MNLPRRTQANTGSAAGLYTSICNERIYGLLGLMEVPPELHDGASVMVEWPGKNSLAESSKGVEAGRPLRIIRSEQNHQRTHE